MPHPAIAIYRLEALQVGRDIAAQITLDHIFQIVDDRSDFINVFLRQFSSPQARIKTGFRHHAISASWSDAIEITERVRQRLVTGYIDT